MHNVTIGQYYPGQSVVHRLDPRIKILLTIIYIVFLFTTVSFYAFSVFLIFSAAVILISKLPLFYVIKGVRPLLFIIVFTALINMFLSGGEDIAFVIPHTHISASWTGIRNAAFMVIRLVFLVIGTSLLTLTTSPISLTDGIESLLSPFKKIHLPAHEIAMMMTIAIRFIPTLFQETEKIIKAQTARGADFESRNPISRAKSLVPILVPLFISSFRRADELACAMECRCYHGGEGRTRMNSLKIRKSDVFALILCVAALALSLIIGRI